MEPISEGPEGIILESVLEGFAEYFSADLSQKVKRGLRESALKCKCIGRPPIGYKKGPNAEFVVDEETVPYVHKIFSMFISGEPYQKIADTVNAMGCRSSRGNPLRYSSIAKVLKCEKYIGVYESHGIRIEGGVPAIVSKEDWNAAQERLALSAKGEYSYKNNGASAKQCYLLAGKVFCGECKSPMVGDTTMKKYPSGHQERYSYYSCSRRKCNRCSGGRIPRSERCKKKPIRKDELEGIVKERTRFFLSQPDVLEVIHQACEEIERN